MDTHKLRRGEHFAQISAMLNDKRFEVAFAAVFSVLVPSVFYVLISMNGVVLGNDPAVHLEKAQIFLNTGQISLANLGGPRRFTRLCSPCLFPWAAPQILGN